MSDDSRQYNLYGGTPPHQKESDTSKAAAEQVLPRVDDLQKLVMMCLTLRGGLTDHELVEVTGRLKDTVAPRRRELVLKGLVQNSGFRRKTPSGCSATVWILTDKGKELAHDKGKD